MKKLNEYIDESLLDDEDKVMSIGHSAAIKNKVKQLYNRANKLDPYVDTYGRKLEEGDLVIFYQAASSDIGIITNFIDEDWAYVNCGGNEKIRIYCNEVMKIPSDKAFLELIK